MRENIFVLVTNVYTVWERNQIRKTYYNKICVDTMRSGF